MADWADEGSYLQPRQNKHRIMYYRSLFLIHSKIETKKEKFPGARSEGKIPSRRSWELKLRGRVFWGLRFLDWEGRPVPVCFMYKTGEVGKGVSRNLSPWTSGLGLGTVSPGVRVGTPVGNQTSNPVPCCWYGIWTWTPTKLCGNPEPIKTR